MKTLKLLAALLLVVAVSIPACGRGAGRTSTDSSTSSSTGALAGRDLLLIVADSFHATHVGAHGYERATTPFLDDLARRGVRAERALSQTSWTLSSVASLFTGLVQERHGVLQADQQLAPDGATTLAEQFRGAGYRTVAFVENGVVAPHSGLGRGFDRYEYLRFQGPDGPGEVQARARAVFAEDDPRPLFLYVHLLPPHMPYQPPEPYRTRFQGDAESSILGTTGDVQRVQDERLPVDHADVLRLVELYDENIAFADARIRELVAPRLEGDLARRTAVIVTSDHGEAFMQHGRTGHNSTVYEEMVHVPWILVAPEALDAGKVVRGPVSLLDTFPTVAQLFDLPLPSESLDGRSLVPAFDGEPPARPRDVYLSSRYPRDGRAAQFALARGRWKLVTRRRGLSAELFDVSLDPGEERDRTSEEPDLAVELGDALARRRAELARENAASLTSELTETMIRDLEALGYGGADFDELDGGR